jgi:hypothetical protein
MPAIWYRRDRVLGNTRSLDVRIDTVYKIGTDR